MINHICACLCQKGYQQFLQKDIFLREEDSVIYMVLIENYNDRISVEKYQRIENQIKEIAISNYHKSVELLHLLITSDGMFDENIMHLVSQLENIWLIASDTGRVFVFENQSDKFDDLYDDLDQWMKQNYSRKSFSIKDKVKPVNSFIVLINILYFIYLVITRGYLVFDDTQAMLNLGAISYETFVGGKWYQMITSMFVHFGLSHLINNMILLAYVGNKLEEEIGSLRYFLVYFLSGICGNLLSLLYYHNIGKVVVSAGASGAIFGVLGCLFILLLLQRKKVQEITSKRIFLMIFLTIYYGMTTMGIDNCAHIGGLLAGVICGLLLSKILQYGKLK